MYKLTYLITLYNNDNITFSEVIDNIRRRDNRYVIADNILEYEPDIIIDIMKFGINLRLYCSTCSAMFLSFIITEYSHNRWMIDEIDNQDILRDVINLLDDCKLKYVSQYAREEDIAETILTRCPNCKCIQYKQYKFGMDTENLDQYIPKSLTNYYLYTLDQRAKQIIKDNNVCFEFNMKDMGDIELDICISNEFMVKIYCTCDDIIENEYLANKLVNISDNNRVKIECINKAETYQQLVKFIDFNIKPDSNIEVSRSIGPMYHGFKRNYYKALQLYPDVKQLIDKHPEYYQKYI